MKLTTTHIGVIMAVLVIATAGSTYAISQNLNSNSNEPNTLAAGPLLTGNVKVTHLDEFGNVIGYRQTDNHIVEAGMELIMGQIFNGINDTFQEPSRPIEYMEVGTNGEWRVLYNDTDLRQYDFPGGNLCLRQPVTNTNSTLPLTKGTQATPPGCVAPNCFARYNITSQATFDGGMTAMCASSPDTIDEAGIFNSQAINTGLMFARNTFGGVELMSMDTLVLDWEFTFTDI